MAAINVQKISPVDALWALYQAQSKANKRKFRSLLASEDALDDEKANSKSLIALSSKAEKEMKEGKTLHFESASDAQKWMDSLRSIE